MTQEFVVVYRLSFTDGSQEYCEMFRGSEADCKRIVTCSSYGSCDRKQVTRTQVELGPADEWDAFMEDLAKMEEIEL